MNAINEVAAICIERNVRDATWVHDQIIAGMQGEIDRLKNELQWYRDRDARAAERRAWLDGYGNDEFFIDRR
jgi:hypothetical protein